MGSTNQLGGNTDATGEQISAREVAGLRLLATAAGYSIRGEAARLELGQRLLALRPRWPRCGANAKGWRALLRKIGLPARTASRYVREAAGLGTSRPKRPPVERVRVLVARMSLGEVAQVELAAAERRRELENVTDAPAPAMRAARPKGRPSIKSCKDVRYRARRSISTTGTGGATAVLDHGAR